MIFEEHMTEKKSMFQDLSPKNGGVVTFWGKALAWGSKNYMSWIFW